MGYARATIGEPVCGQFGISGLHDAEEFRLLWSRGDSPRAGAIRDGKMNAVTEWNLVPCTATV